MSIYENVVYPLRIDGVRDRGLLDETVERALRAAALWDEVKDRLGESALGLSGGQQQRLCIARAIAGEPEVLLMDEPCSALDPIATAKIEELIAELRGHYTILIVTHNMQQAARVTDNTAFMYLGRLIEYGETQTHLPRAEAPAHPGLRDGALRVAAAPERASQGARWRSTPRSGSSPARCRTSSHGRWAPARGSARRASSGAAPSTPAGA